jgi:hypothetical protein
MSRTGCSAKAAGCSVRETGERRNGGAVKEERSPLKLRMVCKSSAMACAGTYGMPLEMRRTRAFVPASPAGEGLHLS